MKNLKILSVICLALMVLVAPLCFAYTGMVNLAPGTDDPGKTTKVDGEVASNGAFLTPDMIDTIRGADAQVTVNGASLESAIPPEATDKVAYAIGKGSTRLSVVNTTKDKPNIYDFVDSELKPMAFKDTFVFNSTDKFVEAVNAMDSSQVAVIVPLTKDPKEIETYIKTIQDKIDVSKIVVLETTPAARDAWGKWFGDKDFIDLKAADLKSPVVVQALQGTV